jgi:uncharacterized protein (DUF1778 family)
MAQDDRYDGRIWSWQKAFVDRAAMLDGKKRGTFMVEASMEASRRVFEREGEDAAEFLAKARRRPQEAKPMSRAEPKEDAE